MQAEHVAPWNPHIPNGHVDAPGLAYREYAQRVKRFIPGVL
jgi:hypothetical protein